MIVKSSQRGGGQDMVTHFLNGHDNEIVEILEMKGFVSDDPHGAAAEVQLQADTLTQCQQAYYSVAVNPDPAQLPWTDEMRKDHRDRMFKALGLENQPYMAFKHIKDGREHYHYAISRIDVEAGKAIPMSFERDKQMMVARLFARDYGLKLPDGYYKSKGQHEGKGQLLLHEKQQQEVTGITKEERMSLVTDIWKQSDSPKAFVAALQEHGYILCTGKRDYVLVDYYGGMNSLPRLIDSKEVRVKQVREFLGKDFPKETLPDVEETREDIAKHRAQFEQLKRSEDYIEKKEQLHWAHRRRRVKLDVESDTLKHRHRSEVTALSASQLQQRLDIRSEYLDEKSAVREQREDRAPSGLAGFLAKASGFKRLQHEFHRRQDRKRFEEYQLRQTRLEEQQYTKRLELEIRQAAHNDDLSRRLRALKQLEEKEMRSLETRDRQAVRTFARKGPEHMPSAALELSPWNGRKAGIYKAKKRYKKMLSEQQRESAENNPPPKHTDLKEAYKSQVNLEKPPLDNLRLKFPHEAESIDLPSGIDELGNRSDIDLTEEKNNGKGKTRK